MQLVDMGNAASNNWATNYRKLKEIHDEAYKNIEEAIKLEELERPSDAVEKYKQGILVIDKALNVVVSSPQNPDETWKEACEMVSKMKKTRAEVMMRISSITSSPSFEFVEIPNENANTTANQAITYEQLAVALNNLTGLSPKGDADVVYDQDNVQLYFISPNGEVTSTLEPQTLRILHFSEPSNETKTFLQVGNWFYPLVGGSSPCLCTDFDAFILPDVYSNVKGSSVGIILPEAAQKEFFAILEDILYGVAKQGQDSIERKAQVDEDPRSSKIAYGLITGAGYISKGLIFGAQKVGDLLNYSTPKIINNLTPAQTSTNVPETVTKSANFARNTSHKAAEVTAVVAEKVGSATTRLGQFLAPHIKTHGTKLLTSKFNYTENEASAQVNNVLNVAAGAVEGFATIYCGLDTSAGILLKSLRENSVKVVQHKYGNSAGVVVDDTIGTVENVINIRNKAKIFTPKGLAKTAVKQTTMAAVNTAMGSDQTSSSTREDVPRVSSASDERDLQEDQQEDGDDESVYQEKSVSMSKDVVNNK